MAAGVVVKPLICVAQFGAAHGVRGEIALRSFTERPADFCRYGPLSSKDGARVFEITATRAVKEHFIVRVAGIDDRDAAQALRNIELYVARDRLPPPADDEFYHADLIGLAAATPAGAALGTVSAIYNFGAGDVIEIAPNAGETLLVPFTRQVVPAIDFAAGRIVVDPPASDDGDDGDDQ
ncbi:MAG TPA: ribosome maturation factor RimM [Pseudolabrys sp.]|nr:ribosome maturation factor RimM [Pseudolabrys sp.]